MFFWGLFAVLKYLDLLRLMLFFFSMLLRLISWWLPIEYLEYLLLVDFEFPSPSVDHILNFEIENHWTHPSLFYIVHAWFLGKTIFLEESHFHEFHFERLNARLELINVCFCEKLNTPEYEDKVDYSDDWQGCNPPE